MARKLLDVLNDLLREGLEKKVIDEDEFIGLLKNYAGISCTLKILLNISNLCIIEKERLTSCEFSDLSIPAGYLSRIVGELRQCNHWCESEEWLNNIEVGDKTFFLSYYGPVAENEYYVHTHLEKEECVKNSFFSKKTYMICNFMQVEQIIGAGEEAGKFFSERLEEMRLMEAGNGLELEKLILSLEKFKKNESLRKALNELGYENITGLGDACGCCRPFWVGEACYLLKRAVQDPVYKLLNNELSDYGIRINFLRVHGRHKFERNGFAVSFIKKHKGTRRIIMLKTYE